MSPTPPKKPNVIKRILAWSYSTFSVYKECPQRARFQKIDKLREPDVPAMIRGNEVHKAAEDFTKGATKKLPKELATFKEEFLHIKKAGGIPEKDWAFDKDWNPCSWFGPQAWLRVKVDLHSVEIEKIGPNTSETVVHIIDHKTGKAPADPRKPGTRQPAWEDKKFYQHDEQRSIYALAAMIMYPDADRVIAKHWYLDAGVEHTSTYVRADLDKLKKEWLKKIKPMMNDTSFAPRPSSDACRFCHFKKSNGGPCAYN